MATDSTKKQTWIPTPQSPITGAGPTPGSAGYDPYGYSTNRRGTGKGHWNTHKFLKKLWKNAPPFMADQRMYNTAISTINDILSRKGQLPPEVLQRQQFMLEAQRQNAARSLDARAAMQGMDPGSVQYQLASTMANQGADLAQQNAGFQNAVNTQNQMRSDLNLVTPYMQMLMGYTAPKANSQVTPVPNQQNPGTDWAGIGANLLGSYINAAAPKGPGDGWNFFGSGNSNSGAPGSQQQYWDSGNVGPVQ